MDLELEHKQTQTLSPRMMLSLKVLQMDAQELSKFLTDLIQENPVLELGDPPSRAAEAENPVGFGMGDIPESHREETREAQMDDREENDDGIANHAGQMGPEETLSFHLLSQLSSLALTRRQERACRVIIDSLSSIGYLDESLEELSCRCVFSRQELEEALSIVQRLDPAGIGARDVRECLRLQLARLEGDTLLAAKIVESGLDALAKCRYAQLAKTFGAAQKEVMAACDLIRTLNPKPGGGFTLQEVPAYITPDVMVDTSAGHPELTLNDSFVPAVKISPYYCQMMKDTAEEEVRTYLGEKIRQAKWVVKCIDQRRSTLIGCAQTILKLQRDFFSAPDGHLVPMSLGDVARELGVHESTVSRAVRGKYLQCSRGIFALSSFFTASLTGSARQEDGISAEKAKSMLEKLIAGEDRRKPLSDQKIRDLMEAAGCPLSRRTVTKYREQLGILPAAGRKRS